MEVTVILIEAGNVLFGDGDYFLLVLWLEFEVVFTVVIEDWFVLW